MSSQKLFIVIEGMDGAGKTTVLNELARDNGVYTIDSPPDPFAEFAVPVITHADPLARIAYFLAANLQVSSDATQTRRTRLTLPPKTVTEAKRVLRVK